MINFVIPPPPCRCGHVAGPHPNQGRGLPDGGGPASPPPSGCGGERGAPSRHPALLQHLVLAHHPSLAVPQWPRHGRGRRGVTEPEQQLGAPAGGHQWNVGGLSRRRRDSEGPRRGEPVLLLLRDPVCVFMGQTWSHVCFFLRSGQGQSRGRSVLLKLSYPFGSLGFDSCSLASSCFDPLVPEIPVSRPWTRPPETHIHFVQDSLAVPHSANICTAITALAHVRCAAQRFSVPDASRDTSGPLRRGHRCFHGEGRAGTHTLFPIAPRLKLLLP